MIKDMEDRISKLQQENQSLRQEEQKEEEIRSYRNKLSKLGDENGSLHEQHIGLQRRCKQLEEQLEARKIEIEKLRL
jgi:predicted  nucleic acid-binding Zn-ribbon protein